MGRGNGAVCQAAHRADGAAARWGHRALPQRDRMAMGRMAMGRMAMGRMAIGHGDVRRRGAGDGARAMFALAPGLRCSAFDRWGEFW